MKNFLLALHEYEKDGCKSVGFKITPNNMKVQIPKCIKKSEFLNAFFEGTNVCSEEVTTFQGFKYVACINHKKHFSESEDIEVVKKILSKGLKKVQKKGKINYNLDSDIKLIKSECLVIITLSPISKKKIHNFFEKVKRCIKEVEKKVTMKSAQVNELHPKC